MTMSNGSHSWQCSCDCSGSCVAAAACPLKLWTGSLLLFISSSCVVQCNKTILFALLVLLTSLGDGWWWRWRVFHCGPCCQHSDAHLAGTCKHQPIVIVMSGWCCLGAGMVDDCCLLLCRGCR
jgi:hypothetical protein